MHRGWCRFSSQTRDGRYCRARYYHPGLQRFISEDPIGFAGGDVNLYAYVGNSPTGLIDPLGLDAWSDAGNLAAGFGDTLTLGGTAWVRGLWTQQFGLPDTVDASSSWNLAGRKTAHAWDAAMAILTGAAALRAAPSVLPLLTNEIGGIITRKSVVEGFKFTIHAVRKSGLGRGATEELVGSVIRGAREAGTVTSEVVAGGRFAGHTITTFVHGGARVVADSTRNLILSVRPLIGFRF